MSAYQGIYLAIALIDGILHLIGIIVLRRQEEENPKIIISNLSLCELLFCMSEVIHYCFKLGNEDGEIVQIIFSFIRYAIFLAIKFVMLYLITDRYIAIDWQSDYYVYFTRERIFNILFAMWALGALFGLVLGVLFAEKSAEMVDEVENFISLAVDIVITLFGLRTIIYYYENKSKMEELRAEQSESGKMEQYSNFTFYIPCLVVLAYIVWNALATLIFQKKYLGNKHASNNGDVIKAGKIMILIGFGLQALLYTYVQEEGKKKVLELFGIKTKPKKDDVKPVVPAVQEKTNPAYEGEDE